MVCGAQGSHVAAGRPGFLAGGGRLVGPRLLFLHQDTVTQDVAAIDLIHGCWGYTAATLAPMVILSVPFALFGPNPVWEMLILTLLGALMAVALFRLTARLSGSRRWALVGTLWFISLPAILYYTRMHIGYPLAFFALGLMLHADRRYLWAGIGLGLAFTSHFNFMVPVAAWLGFSALFDPDTRQLRHLAALVAGVLLPLVVLETAHFLYTGIPFEWVRSEIADALRLSNSGVKAGGWPVTHLIHMMSVANGWLNAALIVLGVSYPLMRRQGEPLLDAIYASGWSIVIFYSLRVSLMHNTFLTPRMFAGAYPLLAVASTVTAMRAVAWVKLRTPVRWQSLQRAAGVLIIVLGLPLNMFSHALDAFAGSQTAYPAVDQVMAQAAQAGLPVRYFGTFQVAQYYGQRYGVEVSINEDSVDIVTGDQQAVLIFESASSSMLNALEADPQVDSADYIVTTYPSRTLFAPARIEAYNVGPAKLNRLAQRLAEQAQGATDTLVVWWPRSPSGVFHIRSDPENMVGVYQGGCVSPKTFAHGTQNFYDLLIQKGVVLWDHVRSGDLGGAAGMVWRWLRR